MEKLTALLRECWIDAQHDFIQDKQIGFNYWLENNRSKVVSVILETKVKNIEDERNRI